MKLDPPKIVPARFDEAMRLSGAFVAMSYETNPDGTLSITEWAGETFPSDEQVAAAFLALS